MSVRKVLLVSVCSAFLAASAAVSGSAAATSDRNLVSQAYKALQVGDAAAAVEAYTSAIESRKLEPEVLANALLNRGLSFQRLNEHLRAVDDYTAAMRIDAMSAKLRALALYNRGLSYQRLQSNAQAIEDFTNALFLDSQFSHAYYSRGTMLRDTGQHLFALADFDKAIRFNYPDQARVHFAEALTYEKLGRKADARNALKKALAAKPNYEPAMRRLVLLDEKRPTLQVATASDQIATATIAAPARAVLPVAQAPSAELLGQGDGGTVQHKSAPGTTGRIKKFTDRVPASNDEPARIIPASVSTAQVEKIIEIEEVPAEAPEQAEAAPAYKGWAVQIASASSEDAAWSTWKKMKARHRALADKDPVVVRADLGDKGIYYRVRLVGFDNQSDAKGECSRLKSKGVRCYISKSSS